MGGGFEALVGTEALAGHLPGHQDNAQSPAWSEARHHQNIPRASVCFPRALVGRGCLSQPPVLLPQEALKQLHLLPGQPWGLWRAGGAAGGLCSALSTPPPGAAVLSFILKIGILHSVCLGQKN